MIWILSLLSAYLYWVGGRGKEDPTPTFLAPLWLRDKIWKRAGCATIALAAVITGRGFDISLWWVYILFWGLNFAALTTYHDYLGEEGTLPNGEKYREENIWSWMMTGFCYGLVAFPLYWTGVTWQMIMARSALLTILIVAIRKIKNVHIQESGSGLVYIASLPIL